MDRRELPKAGREDFEGGFDDFDDFYDGPETLLNKELIAKSDRIVKVGFVLVVLLLMLVLGWWLHEREFGPALAMQREYSTRLAEELHDQDQQLSEKDLELSRLQTSIEHYRSKVMSLELQLQPVDANGVRKDRMAEFYGQHDPTRTPPFSTDEEFRLYCQVKYAEAVLPSNDWTAESVLATWLEQPEVWAHCSAEEGRVDFYFTWTPNYAHCFILDSDKPYLSARMEEAHEPLVSGWLVVDGLRVAMFDQSTYDISDPYEMIRQYQAGEWDGTMRRSHDGSTTVEVRSYDGMLDYEYEAWWYDESFDPEGVAWQEFAERPWWYDDDVPWETLQMLSYQERPKWPDEIAPNEAYWMWPNTKFYADLPLDYNMKELVVADRLDDGELLVAEARRIRAYSRGKLLGEWDLAEALATDLQSQDVMLFGRLKDAPVEYAHDVAYLYTQGQLLALREGGEVAVALERVIGGHDWMDTPEFGLQEGRLIYWDVRLAPRIGEVPTVLAEDVLEADFSTLALLRKADGCYMVTRDENGDYVVEYLGTESMQYYSDYCQRLLDSHFIS